MNPPELLTSSEAAKRAYDNRDRVAITRAVEWCLREACEAAGIGHRSCEVKHMIGPEAHMREAEAILYTKGFTVTLELGEEQKDMLAAKIVRPAVFKLDWSAPVGADSDAAGFAILADAYDANRPERERIINEELLPEVITKINEAVERARSDCVMHKPIPADVAAILREKGYRVVEDARLISWSAGF